MRFFIKSNTGKIFFFFILLVMVSVVSLSNSAWAGKYQGTIFGRAAWYGYFDNNKYASYNDPGVLPPIDGNVWGRNSSGGNYIICSSSDGLSIPYCVNSVPLFVDFLRYYYNSGDAQQKTGTAFIVDTMLGMNAPGGQRNVSDENWSDVQSRLDQTSINWSELNTISAGTINTYYQECHGNNVCYNDDAFFANNGNETRPTITISSGGLVVYRLFRTCANPIGEIQPLPVSVPYSYTLTPTVSTDISGVVEADTSFSVTPTISNSGSTSTKNTQWRMTQIIVQPGQSVPNSGGGNSISEPCGTYFQSAGSSCSTVEQGTTVFDKNGGVISGDSPTTYPTSAGDLDVGTKICFALSVQPRAGDDDQWAHSAPVCLVVGKKPKVQFWGGNLLVGGLIKTSTSDKNINGSINTFGSWDEYGIFTVGQNIGMASGSAFAGSGLPNVISACDYSTISFTNSGNSSCSPSTSIGNYVTSGSLPAIAATLVSSSSVVILVDTVVPNNLITGSGVFIGTRTGDLTLQQSQLDPEKSIILKVSGTVTITGDQTYNKDNNGAKYTDISQLPQLVIIADKIIIKDSVTNVDAWLVAVSQKTPPDPAAGILDTCSINPSDAANYTLSGNDRLTTNKCNSLLTVNGPVIAQHLWLRRTAGSGPGGASGDPGEIFNLRADAYLWAAARASSSVRIQTVYTTELPPRF